MPTPEPRGLPPRIYLPIVALIAAIFLGAMAYLVNVGYGVTGSVFGTGTPGAPAAAQVQQATNVQGGPPPAVMEQLQTLRARVTAHPRDDVALTQLGDMYLAAGKFAEAIPLYRRALRANAGNVAAQTGLQQAKAGLAEASQQ